MSNGVKIVIASGIYPPDIGGPATYSQLVAEEFKRKGHNVSVICYSDKEQRTPSHTTGQAVNREQFPVIRILRKHNKLLRYWLYFWELMKIARDADVIYAQGPLGAGLPAMWVAKILKKRFVIKIVGDYAWEQYANSAMRISLAGRAKPCEHAHANFDNIEDFQKKEYNSKVERMRSIQKKVVRSADRIIVPSEFLKKIAKGWGINEKKIEVIYNAFSKSEKIKYIKLDKDVIITAGRPEPWKGFDTLKEIMSDLVKENPNFKLVIATKLSHSELMGYFKSSKIFILNSGYEGFSHMILEAMAMGLPVITTNVCGNPEIIKHGYNGILVEYNNKEQLKKAILKLWKDKELQKKFVKNGKKTLEKFNLEIMIDETLKVLSG